MKRIAFALLMLVGAAALVLCAARGLSFEPANPTAYVLPQTDMANLREAVAACMASGGRSTVGSQQGVWLARCSPADHDLGVYAVPARAALTAAPTTEGATP